MPDSISLKVRHPWSVPPLCVDDEEGGTHVYLLAGCRPPPTGAHTTASLTGSLAYQLSSSTSQRERWSVATAEEGKRGGTGGGNSSFGTPTKRHLIDAATTSQKSRALKASTRHLLPPPGLTSSTYLHTLPSPLTEDLTNLIPVITVITEDGPFCSVDAWIAQWQMLAVNRPTLTQALLYRLVR